MSVILANNYTTGESQLHPKFLVVGSCVPLGTSSTEIHWKFRLTRSEHRSKTCDVCTAFGNLYPAFSCPRALRHHFGPAHKAQAQREKVALTGFLLSSPSARQTEPRPAYPFTPLPLPVTPSTGWAALSPNNEFVRFADEQDQQSPCLLPLRVNWTS